MAELSAVPFSALPPASDGYTVLYENDQVCRSDKKLSELVGDKTSSFLTKEQGDSLYQEKGDYLVDEDITGKLDTTAFNDVSGNFLTHQSLDEYASQEWVNNQGFLKEHQPISANEWNDVYETVVTNSSTWETEQDWTDDINAASAYAYEQAVAQIPAPFDPTFLSGEIDKKMDKTFSSNFYPMIGNPSGFLTEENLNDDYYDKTETSGALEIASALDLKQDLLVFDGTNNTIETINGSALPQGGSTPTGLYVPLSASACKIGNDNQINGGGYYGEFAQGTYNTAGEVCMVQGTRNSGFKYSLVQGSANSGYINALAVGKKNVAFLDGIAVGTENTAHNYSIANGMNNYVGERAFSLGDTNSSDQDSLALGTRCSANTNALAIGRNNYASTDVVAIGTANSATCQSIVVGDDSSAINCSIAIGAVCYANQDSLAVGGGTSANIYSLAVGAGVNSDYACLGVGSYLTVSGTAGAIGMHNTALSASMAVGNLCSANTYSFALGSDNEAYYYSVAIGEQNYAYAYSFAFGKNNSAYYGYPDSYNYNVTIGNNNTAYEGGYALGVDNNVSLGGFAYGKNNNISQGWAFGSGLKIAGNVFAIGDYNQSSADVAFVIGYGSADSNRKDIFKILSTNNNDRGIASGKDFWSENGSKLSLLAKLCSAISSHGTGKYNLILNNGNVEVEQILN